jgi:hypothetical protein
MWFGNEVSGFLPSDQTLGTTTTCSPPARGTNITLPQSADPSSLVAIAGTTFFGQKVSSTSSFEYPSVIPTSILGYLDTLPEVREQFNDIPVTSCAYYTPRPDECTIVVTSTSTSCVSGSGNLTRTSCTEKVVTVTSTIAEAASSDSSGPPPYVTNGPILVPRRPAAYLTYNTLPLSGDGGSAALDQAAPGTTTTSAGNQPGNTFERLPSITGKGGSAEDSKPTSKPGEASHTAESQPAEAVIGALVSLAAASQNAAKGTQPGETSDNTQNGDAGNQQSPPGAIEQSETESIGNLLDALRGVASQLASSQGMAATSNPQDSHSDTGEVEPETGDKNTENASKGAPSTTVTEPSVSDAVSNVNPVFTFQGQTVTAGDAVTFGGNAVSKLQNQDGVVIDKDSTVLLSNGEATTLTREDSQQPITISRSGSAFIVNSQTIPANQEVTAGQTTASASASGSSAILYINGTPVSTTGTADGASSTLSTGMGGYINSGIGGDAASGSSDGSSANATDGAVTPFTGDGFRTMLWSGSCGVWMVGFSAFVGVVFLL